jgi:site-specific DNA-methyltransferase (adenine-specific)
MIETKLIHGDCLEKLKELPDCSVDSVVTDPPYGLSFMGKKWDYDVPSVEVWKECLRVLKPGGHLLAFAGTRTQHQMAVRIEDAGFEIRDMIAWVYGSGFPKSHNLKDQWQGWGTALKPALEPITVARKPLVGTVAENVLQHGTGAINVDGCRVGTDGGTAKESKPQGDGNGIYGVGLQGACEITQLNAGRWPANLIHDGSEDVVALFPNNNTGCRPHMITASEATQAANKAKGWGSVSVPKNKLAGFDDGDNKSAARFFYCAKASKRDREGSTHPTMKPTALMRYLCRLVTPPEGIVLDPFMGSGSTGKAAVIEGFNFIGIEREESYMEIAEARINLAKTPA